MAVEMLVDVDDRAHDARIGDFRSLNSGTKGSHETARVRHRLVLSFVQPGVEHRARDLAQGRGADFADAGPVAPLGDGASLASLGLNENDGTVV